MLIVAVVASLGWREAFVLSGIVTLAITMLWAWRAADGPAQHQRVSPEELQLIAAEKEELQPQPLDWAWFARAIRSRNAWLLCASEFCYGLGGFVFLTWFFKYFKEQRQVGDLYSGFFSSCNWLAMAIGAPLGGWLCDRCARRWGAPWGRRLVPLVAIVLSGVCSLIAPRINSDVGSAAVFALAAGFLYAAAAAFWSTLIDITRRGAGILGGLMNGVGSLGGALGAMFFPRLVPVLGYEATLQATGLVAILSGLIWLGIDSARQIDAPSPATSQD
jgi:ACS family D-galactonate transporter-like MFS transporter